MIRRRVRPFLMILAAASTGVWLIASIAAQDQPKPKSESPAQEKPQLSAEDMAAAKAAAPTPKPMDASQIPPSITNFDTEDHGSVYPSPSYLRRFSHLDTTSRLPRPEAPPSAMKISRDPLLQLHDDLVRRQQEAEAERLSGKSETDYNAAKTAPTTESAPAKPNPAKAKAKSTKSDAK